MKGKIFGRIFTTFKLFFAYVVPWRNCFVIFRKNNMDGLWYKKDWIYKRKKREKKKEKEIKTPIKQNKTKNKQKCVGCIHQSTYTERIYYKLLLSLLYIYIYIYIYISIRRAFSVTVIVVGNRIGNSSLNSGRGCLLCSSLEKTCIHLFLLQWVNSKEDWVCILGTATSINFEFKPAVL